MSAQPPHPPLELAERPLRFSDELREATVLAREELGKLYADFDRRLEDLLVTLAGARFHLDRTHLEAERESAAMTQEAVLTLAAQLDRPLEEWGVRVEDRTGQAWRQDWTDVAEVRGFARNDALSQTVIAHMEQPIIFRGAKLLAKGIVTLEGPQRD